MTDKILQDLRDLIQEDVGGRGLATDSRDNLLTACPGDLAAACGSIAGHPQPAIGIVTGFFIPHARPPCGETDGPLGAIFLARALAPLGMRIVLAAEAFCIPALEAGLEACALQQAVKLVTLPSPDGAGSTADYCSFFNRQAGPLTHLIALERPGPSHTADSLRAQASGRLASKETLQTFLAEVPPEHQDRCQTMRGRDITAFMSPAHWLFEVPREGRIGNPCYGIAGQPSAITTIGIGDGGNEIGMGKIPWEVIRRNVPGGGLIACRVPADHLIACGISNWGAYGLAAGVRLLAGPATTGDLFDPEKEKEILALMVEKGPLVDGVIGLPQATVDGIPFERYGNKLREIGQRLTADR